MMDRALRCALVVWLAGSVTGYTHLASHPSVHDTVAGILDRLQREKTHSELQHLTLAQVEAFLSPAERSALATEYLSFRVNVPVRVSVIRDTALGNEPFWLRESGFKLTPLRVKIAAGEFDVWQKDFPAGRVGLGVNSLTGRGDHYCVAVAAAGPEAAPLEITGLYPGQLRLGTLKRGEKVYADRDGTLAHVPPELEGQTLVRTEYARRGDARLLQVLLVTEHPSSRRPDHLTLTWSDDPRVTQTIQWRTGPATRKGVLAYRKKSGFHRFQSGGLRQIRAQTARLLTPRIVNDPMVYWHTVTLRGLEPGTAYVYSVGSGAAEDWTELAEFITAPEGVRPFSFVYMGDAQNGLDRWGTLVSNAFRERPDAAFYIMAGDLVNRGAERDDWDSFFYNAQGVFNSRPVVPAIGNHECQGGEPALYLKFFDLPRNGPPALDPERAYAFEYSNAQFIVLDSNLPPESQTAWLEQQLASTRATWKFVVYHHPAYSSAPNRDNRPLRQAWTPLFDKYHVDLALQGHDHAYLRTYPMNGNRRAASPKDGTVYVVSVSGTKMYAQDPRDYTEFGMTNVATYQVLDIQVSGDRLVYRAYDIDGRLRDELVIEK